MKKKSHLLFMIDLLYFVFLSPESKDFTGRVIKERKQWALESKNFGSKSQLDH